MSTTNELLVLEHARAGYTAEWRAPDRIPHPVSSRAKRVMDIVGASVALVVLSPVALAVGVAVFLTGPGRTTFRQKRVGLDGERFAIVKFRTMVRDAEAKLHSDPELHQLYLENDHKIPAHIDPRITKVGGFLRKTSLDELPQLWNVLRGHMSLVGPRPIVESELDFYGPLEAVYKSVRPGITGPWQAGGRSTVSYDARVQMDADYVMNWSLWGDVKIILKTIPAVLARHGAH